MTVVLLLSLALYVGYYWAFGDVTPKKYEITILIIWCLVTVILVRKDFYVSVDWQIIAFVALTVPMYQVLPDITDYVQRRTSELIKCSSITRDEIGDAKYLLSDHGIEVNEAEMGYYIYTEKVSTNKKYPIFKKVYKGCIVASIKKSGGIYIVDQITGMPFNYFTSSISKMSEHYNEFRDALSVELQYHWYDETCRCYRRVLNGNNSDYDNYMQAVKNASSKFNGSNYDNEIQPVLLEPVREFPPLSDEATLPDNIILFPIGWALACFILIIAPPHRPERIRPSRRNKRPARIMKRSTATGKSSY